MLAMKGSKMPDNYMCICKDDGKLYIWNSTFTPSTTLGRFKPYEEVMDVADAVNQSMASPTSKAKLESALSATVPNSLKTALESQPLESGLKVDTAGNILIKTLTEEEIHEVID